MFAVPASTIAIAAALAAPQSGPEMNVSASAPAQASAVSMRDSRSRRIRARVPMSCSARLQAFAPAATVGDTVNLGTLREYCNSPSGYAVVVSYTPGTLTGMRLDADGESVVLDGSGRTLLSRVAGPKVRERQLSVTAGQNGFDANSLSLHLLPL